MPKAILDRGQYAKAVASRPKPYHRSTVYEDYYPEMVYKLCLLGATDMDIGLFFNVSEQTIHNWRHRYPQFAEACYRGKEIADSEVAFALYQRAVGYSHPEEVLTYDRTEGRWERAQTLKQYPPDTAAATMWLINRRAGNWKRQVALTDADGKNLGPITIQIEGV
jgi:hypothetical protein